MIDYTATIIERILKNIPPGDIMDDFKGGWIGIPWLKRICFAAETYRTEPDIEKQLENLANWVWNERKAKQCRRMCDDGKTRENEICFFDLVDCFAVKVIKKVETEIVYRYKYLEPWHRMSFQTGEDLFVTYACACSDSDGHRERESFSWDWILNHDNYDVNRVLEKGVSDNHYHLFGSIPYVDLAWSSLMNSVVQPNTIQLMEQLGRDSRDVRPGRAAKGRPGEYNVLHLKAVLIRAYLYSVLTDQPMHLGEYRADVRRLLNHILESERPDRYVLGKNGAGQRSHGSLREYLEKIRNGAAKQGIQKNCPGAYWFFWVRCPDIPMGVLRDPSRFFCQENLYAISEYVEEQYPPFSMEEVRWLYGDGYALKYRKEWNRQTKREVYRLLSDPDALVLARDSIQRAVEGFRGPGARRRKDYMQEQIPFQKGSWQGRMAVQGERWFLYTMFYHRFQPFQDEPAGRESLYSLFFTYLAIKNRFWQELVHCNEKIGFANFEAYQKRKTWFTTSFSTGDLAKSAVWEAFRNRSLRSLELRIKPQNSCLENVFCLKTYDLAICGQAEEDLTEKYYYVFHFGKRKDDTGGKRGRILLHRHEKYRRELKRQTAAICRMRETDTREARRLRGVDACASEDGCRPEVFATAFRVLKQHTVPEKSYTVKVPQMRLSYHVGEDNQDVLDGIRAIDEAVYFFNMESGDRLGHATMLGVDPWEWYYERKYSIAIRMLDYLDNVVWLYEQIVNFHLPNDDNLLEYLEREYFIYFERVYRKGIESEHWHERQPAREHEKEGVPDEQYFHGTYEEFDIHTYYTAWKLRGDNPEYYKYGAYDRRRGYASAWDDNGTNPKVRPELRDIGKAAFLYYIYHYNGMVREEGNKSISVRIPFHMIRGIQAVQREMIKYISKKGISIETNPTSNVLVAGLRGYGNHPIVNFYNKGLVEDRDAADDGVQVHTSINTDDAGVFMTSLANEYSLMAKALEAMADKKGNPYYKKDRIFEWLDRIRQMGNEQSFIYDEKMKAGGRETRTADACCGCGPCMRRRPSAQCAGLLPCGKADCGD